MQPDILASDWYDAKETMQRLRIKERTLRTWVSEGRIKTKLNPLNTRQRLYRAEDVDRLAKDGPPAPPRKPAPKAERTPSSVVAPTLVSQLLQLLTDRQNTERADAQARWEAEQKIRSEELRQRDAERRRAEEHNLPWLTLDQAICEFGLTAAAIRYAVKEGKLVATKRGGLRIRRTSLEQFEG